MQLLKRSKEKFVRDGETLRSRTICKKNRGGVREWIRWLCTENKPLFLLGAGETETVETEIAGVGDKKKVMPQATRSSRLRRVAMGGVCPTTRKSSQATRETAKSREHPVSLARKCVYRRIWKALSKLGSLKAAVSQRNKFLFWNKEINPSSAMVTLPETKAFNQICMWERLTEQLGILR